MNSWAQVARQHGIGAREIAILSEASPGSGQSEVARGQPSETAGEAGPVRTLLLMIVGALRGFALASGIGYVVSKTITGVDRRFQARNKERKAAPAGPASREQRQAAVQAYLDALTNPDLAFEVPMAESIVRTTGGIPTGYGREQLQWELHMHLAQRLIGEVEVLDWSIGLPDDPDTIRVRYRVRTKIGPVLETTTDATVPSDGLIHRIANQTSRAAGTSQN